MKKEDKVPESAKETMPCGVVSTFYAAASRSSLSDDVTGKKPGSRPVLAGNLVWAGRLFFP